MKKLVEMVKWISIVAVVVIGLSGCCTIMSGSTQAVLVSSDPPGAKVTVSNGTFIIAPGSLTLKRSEIYILVAEYPGHETQQQTLIKKLNNWVWLDPFIDFGIISIPIDVLTGSINELRPKEVHFNFKDAVSIK